MQVQLSQNNKQVTLHNNAAKKKSTARSEKTASVWHICRISDRQKIKSLVSGIMDENNKGGWPHQEGPSVVLAKNHHYDAKQSFTSCSGRQCVNYSIQAVRKQKARVNGVPTYLKKQLIPHVATRLTWSVVLQLLTVARLITDSAMFSFCMLHLSSGTVVCRHLLRNCEPRFKKHLKT